MRSSFRIAKFTSSILGLLSLAAPAKVHAQGETWGGRCVQTFGSGSNTYQVATLQGFECLVGNILRTAIPIIGLATFVMLIVGSFQFLTSQGNPKEMEGAKKTISFAIFGLILALSAWLIINFLSAFTGVGLGSFSITLPTATP